jgi:hypothetical protein
MRLTFLGPPGNVDHQPRTINRAEWQREFALRSRPTEQAVGARLTQVFVGIGLQFLILRLGLLVVGLSHIDAMVTMDFGLLPIYLTLLVLAVYVISALAAGAIAGAWCVNWVFQGIAVGLGWAGVVIAQLLFYLPFDMVANLDIPVELLVPLMFTALVNTVLAIAGAFLGHLLVQPLRHSIEGDGYR